MRVHPTQRTPFRYQEIDAMTQTLQRIGPLWDRKGGRFYDRLYQYLGGVPSRNMIQNMATHETKAFPDPMTLTGLQRGLPSR